MRWRLHDSPHNDTLGVCFAHGDYSYDHDLVAMTPERPVPSCDELPPAGTPPADCTCAQGRCSGAGCPDGLADEWGCSSTMASTHELHPALASFRISYGGLPVRFAPR